MILKPLVTILYVCFLSSFGLVYYVLYVHYIMSNVYSLVIAEGQMRPILAMSRSESGVWTGQGRMSARARLRRVYKTDIRYEHGGC